MITIRKSPLPARRLRRVVALAATVTAIAATGHGASAPTAPTAPTPASDEAPVQLAVFEVGAQKDVGYAASTAMLGTRTNEKLENLPNSISIMTQEFIEDLAFNNYLDAIDFAVSAENTYNSQGTVGAVSGNQSGNEVNFRSFSSIRQLRDGFPMYIVADSFNTERLEFGRGPGGLAYVPSATDDPARIDVDDACDRFLRGKTRCFSACCSACRGTAPLRSDTTHRV